MTTKRTKQKPQRPKQPLGNIILWNRRISTPLVAIEPSSTASIPGAITQRVKIYTRTRLGTTRVENGYCWYPNAREGEQP